VKLLQEHPDKIAKLASGAKVQLEKNCDMVEGAKVRSKSWWQGKGVKLSEGPQCKCKSDKHHVYCGQTQVANRNFLIRDVVKAESCFFENKPYCSKEPKTPKDRLLAKAKTLGCHAVAGAVPRHFLFYPNCKCEDKTHKVFCGKDKVGDRRFSMKGVINSNCPLPYCATSAIGVITSSLMQLEANKSNFLDAAAVTRTSSASLVLVDALLWLPTQLLNLFSSGAANALDYGQSVWWFAFNNVYGTTSTVEAFETLQKTRTLAENFNQWTAIITFFIWLLNDAIFVGWNHAMCPRITEWMALMENARTSAVGKDKEEQDAQRRRKTSDRCGMPEKDREECGFVGITGNECMQRGCCWKNTTSEATTLLHQFRIEPSNGMEIAEAAKDVLWCFKAAGNPTSLSQCGQTSGHLHKKLVKEMNNTYAMVRRLHEMRGDAQFHLDHAEIFENLSKEAAKGPGEDLDLDILEVHKKATELLQKELVPELLCPIAKDVLDEALFLDPEVDKDSQVSRAACKCRPLDCECDPSVLCCPKICT
jgi:hypothetical protein